MWIFLLTYSLSDSSFCQKTSVSERMLEGGSKHDHFGKQQQQLTPASQFCSVCRKLSKASGTTKCRWQGDQLNMALCFWWKICYLVKRRSWLSGQPVGWIFDLVLVRVCKACKTWQSLVWFGLVFYGLKFLLSLVWLILVPRQILPLFPV